MRVLIVDDEPLARALLSALLAELPGLEVVGEAAEGAEAAAAARAMGADLVFLDIDMPGLNGVLAAAEIIRGGAEVVFVTAHEGHAVEAYELDAADYLMKPVRRLRLAAAIDRVRRRRSAKVEPAPEATVQEDVLWVPVTQGVVRLPFSDVMRVEAAGDHVYLHTAQRAFLYRATMSGLQARLEAAGLLRVHRSAFVRPAAVQAIQRSGKRLFLRLSDGHEAPVGPLYRIAALGALMHLAD